MKARVAVGFLATLGLWPAALAGCVDEPDLSPCDIRERGCQDAVFYAVQGVRGGVWDPWLDHTPVRVISQAQFRREQLDDAAAEMRTAQDAEFNHFEAALELLGLLDPERTDADVVAVGVAKIAAYYDRRTRSVTVIDRGDDTDDASDTRFLAHEFVHAAQDRELGLADFAKADSRDASYARRAVIEGEATFYGEAVLLDHRGSQASDVDWDEYFRKWLWEVQRDVYAAASPELELPSLLYPLGGDLIAKRYLAGGSAAVADAWTAVPQHIGALMGETGPAPPAPCGAPEAPAGYELRVQTRMGRLSLFGAATRFTAGADQAWAASGAWRGDQMNVYGDDRGETVLVWVLLFDPGAAESFVRSFRAHHGDGTIAARGNVVHIMLRSEAEAPQWDAWTQCPNVD